MKQIYGKSIYETVEEAIQPTRTALVVIDMQNDFAHVNGHRSTEGKDTSRIRGIIDTVDRLVRVARQQEIMVVWVKNTTLPSGSGDSGVSLKWKSERYADIEWTMKGSWGHEIVAPLSPLGGEPVVEKLRSCAFFETNLNSILRAGGVESVVLTGCVTEGCVFVTARSAAFHGYYTHLAEDCVASIDTEMEAAGLKLLRSHFPVRPSQDYINAWQYNGD